MTTTNLPTSSITDSQAEVAQLIERLRSGDVRALARAISLVENNSPLAAQILSGCFPYAGNALCIGITGAPGAGKSTLVDRLARQARSSGRTVGIVAVDPTSPFTGGAILGDRIRMQESLGDDGLYVRSMATRGALGGLARTTADVASVIAASGKQTIFIETVGVGQDEIEIVRLADITIVVLVPGMGDDVQSIKAGIMEIADIFVVNKSDREGADRVEKEVRSMQSYASEHGGWIPPVVRTIASNGEGISELVAVIDTFRAWLSVDGRLEARRRAYWRERILEMMRYELMREVRQHGLTDAGLEERVSQIAGGTENPYELVPKLVRHSFASRTSPQIPTPSLDHIGIAVKSIKAAKMLYESLGLSVAHEETVAAEQVRTAMIPIESTRIELLEPTAEDSPVGRFLAKRGEGLHHVALKLDDIAAALTTLKEQGAQLVSDQVQVGAGGHLYFFIHPSSTGGVLLEICQDPN